MNKLVGFQPKIQTRFQQETPDLNLTHVPNIEYVCPHLCVGVLPDMVTDANLRVQIVLTLTLFRHHCNTTTAFTSISTTEASMDSQLLMRGSYSHTANSRQHASDSRQQTADSR
jgi:hypothetical protein